jgi:serpin B
VFDLVVMPNDPTAARPDCESLIELITSTIRPESWRVAGGDQGECKEYVGAGIIGLVITQSEEVHEEIAALLAALRAARVTGLAGAQTVNPPVERPYYPSPIVFGMGYSPADHTEYLTGTKIARPPEMTSLFRQLVDGKTEFACKLYRKLANKSSENFVYSPYGASASLETLLLGARRKTAEEIRTVLNLPDDPSTIERLGLLHAWIDANKSVRGYQLMSRTRLLVGHDEPLLASFVGRTATAFNTRIEPLDFTAGRTAALLPLLDAARLESGGFVGLQGLTDDVDEQTRLFVLNTTSFRGRWATPFSSSQTLREFFYAPTGKLNVEMMHTVGPTGYREADGIQIVKKEYAGLPGVSRAAFYILLPSSAPGALSACEQMLSQQKLARWLDEIEDRPVELHLPKFTFENQSDFRQALVDLGVWRSFSGDPETGADFSGINGSRTLRLEGLRQRAKIEVNEEETQAVAQTAAPVGYFGAGTAETELPKRVRCDRPFLFLIRDEHTGSILFMGRVAAPDNEPTAAVAEPPTPKP